ncbi:MAG: DUF1730 domain-containing protein [Bacteroidales bacterium]|nr:DUF1730 domain-containing protein [Bacteroidales bacterium]
MLNSDELKRIALEVGFDACGVARAEALTDEEYPLRRWLARGWHGDLAYMERNADKRMDPRLLLPGARSVICCVSAYGPPDATRNDGVAAYAQRREYHEVVKNMLHALRERLGIDGKVCCDTVPISDKHWAARAGLGWIGRHTLLVTPQWGSWVNLGEIVTTEICDTYDSPVASGCYDCNLCVDACPNKAIAPLDTPDSPYMIDVRRCTAYYTTHHPQAIPPDIDAHGYTQGCDICQLACPYN